MIQAFIFDLDGTLVDTMPYHYEAWKNAARKYGSEIDNDFLLKYTGSPSLVIASEIVLYSQLNDRVTNHQLLSDKMVEFYKLQHKAKPIIAVTGIVKKYFGILPMAIGTGGHRETVERTLKITDLRKYFEIIVTANDIKSFKPDPETFLKCAELMKVDPRLVEVFEDTEQGLEAARISGMIATDIRPWRE